MHNKQNKANLSIVSTVAFAVMCSVLVILFLSLGVSWFVNRNGMETGLFMILSYLAHPLAVFAGVLIGTRKKGAGGKILALIITCVYFMIVVAVNILVVDAGTERVIPNAVGCVCAAFAAQIINSKAGTGTNRRKYRSISR